MDLKEYIGSVWHFPKEGVDFKDITPLINNAKAFRYAVEKMSQFVEETGADVIVAPEARGFLFAAPVAFNTNTRLVLVRKPGKLPRECHKIEYSLEYGSGFQEMHKGDVRPGDNVVVIDDVLATGGTIEAIIKMIELEGAKVKGISFLADLKYLHKPGILDGYNVQKLVEYDE